MEHASDMPRQTTHVVWVFVLLIITSNGAAISVENNASVPIFEVEIIAQYPHDNTSWTQGLLIHNGSLYESKGHYGESSLRQLDLETGLTLRELQLNETYFAEGIAVVEGKLIMLTWRENIAFVIDLETFEVISNYSYQGEGWGLCYDGSNLIMSDGSSKLHFRDPTSFELLSSVNVTLNGEIYDGKINELECTNNQVYANLWYKDEIILIDPLSGKINSIVKVTGLDYQLNSTMHEILNGIAYDSTNSSFLITGKNWPTIYRVDFVESKSDEKKTNNSVTLIYEEPSSIIPILVVSLLSIVWAFDMASRHKVKRDDDKPKFEGGVV